MPDVQRFPFVEARDAFGDVDVVPRLPLRLCYGDRQVETSCPGGQRIVFDVVGDAFCCAETHPTRE
jgi:hypothetical protein